MDKETNRIENITSTAEIITFLRGFPSLTLKLSLGGKQNDGMCVRIHLIPVCFATICHSESNLKDIRVFISPRNEGGCAFLCGVVLLCLTKIEHRGEWSCSVLLHHALPDDLLAESEGEGVCCCSDLVLCLHMGHVFCIGTTDGHHPVSHPDASLSCLPGRGQLERRKTQGTESREKLEVHVDRVFTGDDGWMWMKTCLNRQLQGQKCTNNSDHKITEILIL